tara:strand:- start:14785 stop:15078 length:294 start_codon:yes stop_codon:yes gene_type:complete
MASKTILTMDKISEIRLGYWLRNDTPYYQVQVQAKNGRRFILLGSRTSNEEKCANLIEKIKSKGQINLSNFIEVQPDPESEAYSIMKEKGILETLES